MLGTLGLATLEALIDRAVPAAIRITEPLALSETKSERETVSYLRRMRDRNRVFISMLGMGYYGTVVPAVIRRNVLENPGWYTAYTPYQAEVSQGRLEALCFDRTSIGCMRRNGRAMPEPSRSMSC